MSSAIHINTARRMLDRGDPVSLRFVKKNGEIVNAEDVVSLSYDVYTGLRTIKYLRSNEKRTIRDCLIIGINDFEVFL